jgi:hypothetical protein
MIKDFCNEQNCKIYSTCKIRNPVKDVHTCFVYKKYEKKLAREKKKEFCNIKSCNKYDQCKNKNPFKDNLICDPCEEYVNANSRLRKRNVWPICFTDAKIDVQQIGDDTPSAFTNIKWTKKALILKLFFFDRATDEEIMELCDCSQMHIDIVIRECRLKILEEIIRSNKYKNYF